jgi:glyoxylate reductase
MKVIATRRLPDAVEARMRALFDVDLNGGDAPMSRAALAAAISDCDVLAIALTDRIDAGLIGEAGARLKLIANYGAGIDNVDLAAAAKRGIAVTNTPGVLTEDTADAAMGLILMALRGLGAGERVLRAGQWGGWSPTDQLATSLTGKKLGIVGMGRIGQALARRAGAFGMRILYHNRRPVDATLAAGVGAEYRSDLDAMLAEADVVSLNAPYGPETDRMLNRRRIALMRPGAWLINAGRGALVDEDALIEALEEGRIAGAGFDVYPNEPEVNPRLLALRNVVLLPHLGSATHETRTAMGMIIVENILALAEGRELSNRVV